MLISEIDEITNSHEQFKEYVEGDGDGGQVAFTYDLINQVMKLDGEIIADYESIKLIEKIAHLFNHYEASGAMKWGYIEAEEREYVCSDCGEKYLLSKGRILQDSPNHASFVCDICKEGEGE